MKQSIGLRMGQSLAMTPALQQAIRLLQMSTLELQAEIRQALESNLMLEPIEDGSASLTDEALSSPEPVDETSGEAAGTDDRAVDLEPPAADWDDLYDGAAHIDAASAAELYEYRQSNTQAPRTLRDHLGWQASLTHFSAEEAEVALHLIDAIDEDGFLRDWDELCERLGAEHPVERMETVLRAIQAFDPPGVAARDLQECLLLQLAQLPRHPLRRLAERIVRQHWPMLGRKDHKALAQATDEPPEAIDEAVRLIQSLQPFPGRPYQQTDDVHVVPDVIVSRQEGRWKVSLNPEIAPRIRINAQYQRLIRRADRSEDQKTLKAHLQEARFFINSLRSRNDTLLAVAGCIVEEQRAFLEYGEEAMRPLILRDIAQRLGVHESTISRATSGKYMLTPRGLHELKYFFSSHVSTTQGGTCSATAIQAMIRRLIGDEPPGKPLSDAAIADLLLKDGIRVARRTVAKYREAQGLPPAHVRRRMA